MARKKISTWWEYGTTWAGEWKMSRLLERKRSNEFVWWFPNKDGEYTVQGTSPAYMSNQRFRTLIRWGNLREREEEIYSEGGW